MAGANNRALKKAGMTPREVETFRADGGKALKSAAATAHRHSPTIRAANIDFQAKAAAGLKSVADRKAALRAARQQRIGRSLGSAMQAARGMRQKQAAAAAAVKKQPKRTRDVRLLSVARKTARMIADARLNAAEAARVYGEADRANYTRQPYPMTMRAAKTASDAAAGRVKRLEERATRMGLSAGRYYASAADLPAQFRARFAEGKATPRGPTASPRAVRALGELANVVRRERAWQSTNPWRNTDVDGKSGKHWSNELAKLSASKPRPFNKLYRDPSRAPSGAKEKHDAQMREWNSAYRKAQRNVKRSIELSNEAHRGATPGQQAERMRRDREETIREIRRDMKAGKAVKATSAR